MEIQREHLNKVEELLGRAGRYYTAKETNIFMKNEYNSKLKETLRSICDYIDDILRD